MILVTLALVILVPLGGVLVTFIGSAMVAVSVFLMMLWFVFALFTLYFFRDPNASVPVGGGLVVSPGHGKVDAIDTINETQFMEGDCQRISMFLSVIDIHVQNAPVSGKVSYLKHTGGQFLNAMKTECATCNENVYIGIQSTDPREQKIGVKLIAGVLARRIVPFVAVGDEFARGDRISLIQFGSRVDVYLPYSAKIKVKIGDRVVGGESVLAAFE